MSSFSTMKKIVFGTTCAGLFAIATPAFATPSAPAERAYLEARAQSLRSAADTYLSEADRDQKLAKDWHELAVKEAKMTLIDLRTGKLRASVLELKDALLEQDRSERLADAATNRLDHARRAERIAARLEGRAVALTTEGAAAAHAAKLERLARVERTVAAKDMNIARVERDLAREFRREAIRDIGAGDAKDAAKAIRERATAITIAQRLSSEAAADRAAARSFARRARQLEQCSMTSETSK